MRQEINILWLEDDLTMDAHTYRKELVEDILKDKGYKAQIKEFRTFEDARKELVSVKRYDFFISDFNLDASETGLNYLEEIRNRNGFKQFVILYSNNNYNTIKSDVIDVLKHKNLDIFSNFTFFSVSDSLEEKHFEDAINVILCRWDELNALRGRFMCENAEIEHLLREKLGETQENDSYRGNFERFFREKVILSRPNLKPDQKIKYKSLKQRWSDLIDKRNALAHVEEGFTSEEGYYICSLKDSNIKIMESNLDEERRNLVSLKQEIIDFLKKIYY
ncbi:hypothetical protein [Streptococcus sanguinis]|uniref:Uncharacterized protein n=1 Tax=Streptococcus sanguinis TaxID=1305 RepID=A0AAE8FXW0_STRSA|nr:hypothetical protein [Streptococcus sanguinis]RSI09308.1 hypothetical protein D8888_00110 [Streptococcus sanguinis]